MARSTITKDGSPAPFAASTLSVTITGGTSVGFSNITLQFQGGAAVHFGPQLIHGVVSSPITAGTGAPPTPGTTTAFVTPSTLTTSQASVVLDGSGSTSASGKLQYLFEVVPGGKLPALLQSPDNPKATVDFVSGAGTVPGSTGGDRREGQDFDKSRGYVELPAIGNT